MLDEERRTPSRKLRSTPLRRHLQTLKKKDRLAPLRHGAAHLPRAIV